MGNPTLDAIYEDYKRLQGQIDEAHQLLEVARDAGLETASLSANLRSLENKRNQWGDALRKQGYDV